MKYYVKISLFFFNALGCLNAWILAVSLVLCFDCLAEPVYPSSEAGSRSTLSSWSMEDPYESWNRKCDRFNDRLDQHFLKPLATLEKKVMPKAIHRSVSNFFSNLNDLNVVFNDLLQGKLVTALSDTWRLFINTTVGCFGLFDPASRIGLPKHRQDFGVTLATYGMKETRYFVLPFLGPSSMRDMFSQPVDFYASAYYWIDMNNSLRYGLIAGEKIHKRSLLLSFDEMQKLALDPYIMRRDFYAQYRYHLIQEMSKLS